MEQVIRDALGWLTGMTAFASDFDPDGYAAVRHLFRSHLDFE